MARILVAEDDPSVRAFVVSALTMKGHEVVAEEDGGLAAETVDAEEGRFDLLLSDIKMPVMDGIALALHVAARFPSLTILLMTGFADQRERAHGLDALIYDVIPNPSPWSISSPRWTTRSKGARWKWCRSAARPATTRP